MQLCGPSRADERSEWFGKDLTLPAHSAQVNFIFCPGLGGIAGLATMYGEHFPSFCSKRALFGLHSTMLITLDSLRRFAVTRSLFTPTSLNRSLQKLGFLQADPILAPARAQDLILRHRVNDYHAGDLERRFEELGIEEDFFINYGFVTRPVQTLMHPRSKKGVPADGREPWSGERRRQAQLLLEFILERGAAHPREVDGHFSHGSVRNYWGGSSNATTHLLSAMHYRGMLRVARRESGIRVYTAHEHGPEPLSDAESQARLDALVDVAVQVYAPLTGKCLSHLVRRLRLAVPQWQCELLDALHRAKKRLGHARIEGADWYWPAEENPARSESPQEKVRLLAPFDPVVWDRDRFELLWGWAYRFEAYTPARKRIFGYYAMPLLWRDHIIGWGNLTVKKGRLEAEFGYVKSQPPRSRTFMRELEAELNRLQVFLGLEL